MKRRRFEREFFQLAGWLLGCRLQQLGGEVEDWPIPNQTPAGQTAGEVDHWTEMVMLCKEIRPACVSPALLSSVSPIEP